MAEVLDEASALESTTVAINRTATTVKGGRRMSFSALVVVGDRKGRVGVGYGKGRGVPAAIEKAQKAAKKNIFKITSRAGTLPHQVTGKFGASMVRLIPAAPGTGVIAGGTVRAVLEMAGIQDVLTKSYGSTNSINLTKAVVDGLKALRSRESVAALRGVEVDAIDVATAFAVALDVAFEVTISDDLEGGAFGNAHGWMNQAGGVPLEGCCVEPVVGAVRNGKVSVGWDGMWDEYGVRGSLSKRR